MTHFLRYSLLFLLSVFCIETSGQTSAPIRETYKVKKQDTLYGIASAHGITIEELMDANPEMKKPKFRLKKNMKINIPEHQVFVEEDSAADTEPLKDMKTYPGQNLKVGIMLPFTEAADSKRMVEYYRGFIMGCDSLRIMGANVEVNAWDTPDSLDMAALINEEFFYDYDLIVGPLYKHHEEVLAPFCQENGIKMVVPFKLKGGDVAPIATSYQVYEPQEMQTSQAIQQYLNNLADAQPIFITTKTNDARKLEFFNGLKEKLTAMNVRFRTCDADCANDIFASLFSTTQRNAILISSSTNNNLKALFAKLDYVREQRPEVQMAVYGYVDFLIYENTYRLKYHAYDTFVPALFYYNNAQSKLAAFEKKYEEWFRGEKLQTKFLPRLAFTGYDHAQYFLRGLKQMGSDFLGTKGQSDYDALQTPLNFSNIGGLMQNDYFQVVHYCTDRSIEILVPEE